MKTFFIILTFFLFFSCDKTEKKETQKEKSPLPKQTINYKEHTSGYLNEKNYDAALISIQKALEKDPKNPTLYNMKGVAYLGKDLLDSASIWFKKALQYDSCYIESLSNLAAMHIEKQDFHRAIEYANQGINCSSDSPMLYTAYITRGRAKYHLGKKEEGAKDLDSAAIIHPPARPMVERMKKELGN